MPLLYCTLALASVTVIYLFWKSYISVLMQRRRVLRDRVTFMLWVMAEETETSSRHRPEFDSMPDMA